MVTYGYGKILEIDLSNGNIIKTDISTYFARSYVGGMGFSTKILFDRVGPEVSPLSHQNLLIFANGTLTGTQAPCSGRTEVTTRSPLTGYLGSGNTGGIWGAALKHSGYDVLIVSGKSATPVYISIDDDQVQIKSANHIWGKNTYESTDILTHESGPQTSVMTIGPAGENLVKFACPVNDYHHVAGRCGAGAVMGDKKLKAITVRGTRPIQIARPKEYQEAVQETRERLATTRKAAIMPDLRKLSVERGCLPGRNFQTGVLPNWLEAHNMSAGAKYVRGVEGTCWACPMSCFQFGQVNEGKYNGVTSARAYAPGVVYDFGAKCDIGNIPAIWKCKEICQLAGMDYGSAAGCISFALELFQRGIITNKDTDGLDLEWGNEESTIKLMEKIVQREGFGDVLADGTMKAGEKISRGAAKYALTIKGMEMMAQDPRSVRRGFALGELTNPRGGDNIKNTHFLADVYNSSWWIEKFDMFEDVKRAIYGNLTPNEILSTWKGKPQMCKWFEDLYSILNSLGVCIFPSGFAISLGPTYYSKLYSACTGQDTSPQEIMNLGEKILTLAKSYNTRLGLDRRDDTWPDRFYTEPLPEGPTKVKQLSREEMDKVLDEYYALRKWDKKTGWPTEQRLTELELTEVAQNLAKMNKLPPKQI
jgi:aldehyde:ferredoxin oxidoreductase